MEKSPYRVNAFNLFEKFSKSEKNILVLIDGFFPDRLQDKSALYREMTCRAGFELLASGYPGQNTEGTPCVNQFTSSIAKMLREYIKLAMKGKLTLKAPFSFSTLLATVTALNTNPDRVWFTKTKRDYTRSESGERIETPKVVPRFRIDPDYIREHKKFVVHSDIIQDTEKEARDRAAENQKAQEEGERVARESMYVFISGPRIVVVADVLFVCLVPTTEMKVSSLMKTRTRRLMRLTSGAVERHRVRSCALGLLVIS